MDKLMSPAEVKKQFRLAMMMCHPDKVKANDNPEKVYIANRCFAALNEAYNQFKVILIAYINNTYRKKKASSEGDESIKRV